MKTQRRILTNILILLALTLASLAARTGSAAAQGNVYYIAPDGDDGAPGTADEPWATLQHAADTVAPGDEVVVLDGTYAGFRLETSGTAENNIRFRAAGEEAVINVDGPTGDGIRLQNVSYITIEGFRIENVTAQGIAHRGATPDEPVFGLVIRGNTVVSTGAEGMYLSEVADSLVENNTITGADNHGIYLANAGSDGTTIRGNDISGSRTAAIHFNGDLSIGGDGIISGLLVENNMLHDNGQNGLNMDGVQDSLIQNSLDIISPTRACSLTGLTNYTWYTVTLNAMLALSLPNGLESAPFLTDTVRVMPTDVFIYLPLVCKELW